MKNIDLTRMNLSSVLEVYPLETEAGDELNAVQSSNLNLCLPTLADAK
jgi:hypothetical protein